MPHCTIHSPRERTTGPAGVQTRAATARTMTTAITTTTITGTGITGHGMWTRAAS